MWSRFRERWRGYGTFFHCGWISIAGTVLACKDYMDAFGVNMQSIVSQYVPVQYVGLAMIGISAIFAVMRLVTHTAPFQSDEPHAS